MPHSTKEGIPTLTRVPGKEPITIPALDGSIFIADAKDVLRAVDDDCEYLRDASEAVATTATKVEVWNVNKTAKLVEMFAAHTHDLDKICFTQHQIVEIVRGYKTWLAVNHALNFLFRDREQYHAAQILIDVSGAAIMQVEPLGSKKIWQAEHPVQIIVPIQ